MKKILLLFFALFISIFMNSQTDYSESWEDFYSYNNVKDFVKVENTIYALGDNAVFTYDILTQETTKLSSIQGLSGETTSAIYYSNTYNRLIIGYENGLIEVVDKDGSITVSPDIVNFNQTGSKRINHIYEYENIIYLATPFAIVAYNIERVEFGDTYFIGNNSSQVITNKTIVSNNTIYAATTSGIYKATVTNPNLIDFNNWTQLLAGSNITNIVEFNNNLYITEGVSLYEFNGITTSLVRNFSSTIKSLKKSLTNLSVTLIDKVFIFDTNINQLAEVNQTSDFNFQLNTSLVEDNMVFLGTTEFGILSSQFTNISEFVEIHPEGPLNNSPFHIAVQENNLWVVYGGLVSGFAPAKIEQGFSHFNGEEWLNTRYNPDFPIKDLNHISIDPNNSNHVYISTIGNTTDLNSVKTGGVLEINDNEIVNFYNQTNSTLESLNLSTIPLNTVFIIITGSTFDSEGNIWFCNIGVDKRLKKLSPNGQWSEFDLSELFINFAYGMTEIIQDKTNSFWIGTRRNGVYVFNENGNRKKSLTTEINKGGLPNLNVRAVAADDSNRIWIGTSNGLVVFNNAAGLYDADIYNAEPIIILDDGIPKKLLGEEAINNIVVDGGDNKWFGTENAGALYTNPNGQTTLANFNTSNSPLPSNKILKIAVDNTTGKVYFVTDKGIVAYNSNVVPFGDELGDVYAYPNPALNTHNVITIDGRNGTHLPKGTNVKILDVAGNLVYETNVVEGQELQGGKVVWNKTNLVGTKVASGIYIVLLSNDDASETTTTKIAIIN